MATSGSWSTSWASNYWGSASNPKNYNWTGNWSKSGNTITLSGMQIWNSWSGTGWGQGTDTITVTGGSAQSVTLYANSAGTGTNAASLNNTSFSVGSTDTSYTISCTISGENTGYVTLYFDPTESAPTGLSLGSVTRLVDGFTGKVSISGWGNGGSTSQRYLELSVCQASGDTSNRNWQVHHGSDTSWSITTTNTSYSTKHITIQSNTNYWLTMYASNGATNGHTGNTSFTQYTTLPSAPAASSFDVLSTTMASFSISDTSVGSAYPVYLKYRYKKSSDSDYSGEWIDAGRSSTEAVVLSDLEAGESYDVETQAKTSAGLSSINYYNNAFQTEGLTGEITGYEFGKLVLDEGVICIPTTFYCSVSGAVSSTSEYSLTITCTSGSTVKTVTKEITDGSTVNSLVVNLPADTDSETNYSVVLDISN